MLGRLLLSAKDEGHLKRRGKMCKLKKKKKIDTELCLQVPGRESIIKLISPRSLLYSNIFILPLGSVQNKKKIYQWDKFKFLYLCAYRSANDFHEIDPCIFFYSLFNFLNPPSSFELLSKSYIAVESKQTKIIYIF